ATISTLSNQQRPYFAYFHMWSPHEPFAPQRGFYNQFNKQSPQVPARPQHPLALRTISEKDLIRERNRYDSYIASVDHEFGTFLDVLEAGGALEDSYLILTADHGHLFERGELGHVTPLLYDPVIHIPLLISAPAQTKRNDIHTVTSNADILPTALHLAGVDIPSGLDGRVLPLLGGEADATRSIISVDAKRNSAFQPLERVSISMMKDEWKLIRYTGYPAASESYELYNLPQDPFEEADQFQQATAVASQMTAEMLSLLSRADEPYRQILKDR
ncbi:MAG: sulfatase-like hydrolase/transferase, partial [Anaerolineales bacterium]|nr:sulfatase-like hydrolase/transferase [Anaerolineales bacterium]